MNSDTWCLSDDQDGCGFARSDDRPGPAWQVFLALGATADLRQELSQWIAHELVGLARRFFDIAIHVLFENIERYRSLPQYDIVKLANVKMIG